MNTAPLHLPITKGATWTRTFRWTRNGDPVDISGWTAVVQVRGPLPDDALHFEADGVVDGPAGTIVVTADAADTATLPLDGVPRRWALMVTDTDGNKDALVAGHMKVVDGVVHG